MENKQIVKIDPKEFGLEENKAQQIEAQFKPMLEKMTELEKEFNEVIAMPIEEPNTAILAKSLRLKYVKVRTGTAEIHKQQKAFYLMAGRFIDGWKNAQLFASEGIEKRLEEIEKHKELMIAKRIAELQTEREAMLVPYNVENASALSLGVMTDQVWSNFFSGVKQAFESRIEAEKKAELERIETERKEAKERERIRKENERLKAEAEAREKQLVEERAKAEAERKVIEESARKEREEAEKKLRAEAEAREKIENELRKKAEAEYKEKEEAERKAEELRKSERLAQLAPDKEKLISFANKLNEIELPKLKSKEAIAVLSDVKRLIDKINLFITEKTSTL